MHAVRTQCKLMNVGNYLNPSFDLSSLVGYSILKLDLLCIEDVERLNCHTTFSHFSPFIPGSVARSLLWMDGGS